MSITQILKSSAKLWKDKTSSSGWPITARRPRHPALSCSVLQYLTWPRTICISLDQLDHGWCNLGAMRHSPTGGAQFCPFKPSRVSLTLDKNPTFLPLTLSDPDHWQRARAVRQLEDAEVHPINALKCNQPEWVKSLQWQDLDSDKIINRILLSNCASLQFNIYISQDYYYFF